MSPLSFKENFHSHFIKYVLSTYHGHALCQALERPQQKNIVPVLTDLTVYC